MYGALGLTPAQFDRVLALYEELDIPKTKVSSVDFGTTMTNSSGSAVFYINVTFKSGLGNREYTLDRDGAVVDRATITA